MYDHLALSESGFLFDTRTGATYSVSPTGVAILRALMRDEPPRALTDALVSRFEVDPDLAARDVERFVQDLHDLGLLRDADEDGEPDAGRAR